MRQGQFMVYSQGAPKEELEIINTEDYKLKVRKVWVEASKNWHIEFYSQSILDTRYEMFLTQEELKQLREFL
jgi:hypothetical protein